MGLSAKLGFVAVGEGFEDAVIILDYEAVKY